MRPTLRDQVRLPNLVHALLLGAALAAPTVLPAAASAQGRRDDHRHDRDRDRRDQDDRRHDDRRDRNDRSQDTKNGWRNLGIAGGAVGVAGLLTGNRTLAALGLGGGLYSAYRYDQDRRSQDRDGRGRYELFRRRSFDHQGHHYERRERVKDGQRYYYFQRTPVSPMTPLAHPAPLGGR